MKIILATIQTPFIYGGAEYLIRGLQQGLENAGHAVERVSMPFRFSPIDQVRRSMETWEGEDLAVINGRKADLVICLQFPTYYLKHPAKALWLLHHYRPFYDLWNTPFVGDVKKQPGASSLRDKVREKDTIHFRECSPRLTIARNVSSRLERYNGISSTPVYHPPHMAERFYSAPAESYVFVPSRLEETKRHELLIRAMAQVNTNISAIICGDGGLRARLEGLTEELDIKNRVKFIGHVSEEEKLGLYAHCLCVFFGPYDEDYGYVTLEAMLSQKPVITCSDSGGPLEFVVQHRTGVIVDPRPEEIAGAIDFLNSNRRQAAEMGANGLDRYHDLNICWEIVVDKLTGATITEPALRS